jgi:hypothetical protein
MQSKGLGRRRVRDVAEREPSVRDLRAIEAEWPVIAADLAVVAAEIAEASGEVVELASRRVGASGSGVERAA